MGSTEAGAADARYLVSVLPVTITTVRGTNACAMAKDRG